MKFFVIREPAAPRPGKKEDLKPVEACYVSEQTKGNIRILGEGEEIFPGVYEKQAILFLGDSNPVEDERKRCLCLVEGKETCEALVKQGATLVGSAPNECNSLLILSSEKMMHTKMYAYAVDDNGDLTVQTKEQQMKAAILAGNVTWL